MCTYVRIWVPRQMCLWVRVSESEWFEWVGSGNGENECVYVFVFLCIDTQVCPHFTLTNLVYCSILCLRLHEFIMHRTRNISTIETKFIGRSKCKKGLRTHFVKRESSFDRSFILPTYMSSSLHTYPQYHHFLSSFIKAPSVGAPQTVTLPRCARFLANLWPNDARR